MSGDKWPVPVDESNTWKISSKIILSSVGILSKIWAEWLNTTVVYNLHTLHDLVENRPPGTPLITVSNHSSCLDDPILFGVLTLKALVTNNQVMRWTPGAQDICFTKNWHAHFLCRGRVVPIVRGGGVYQTCMDFLVDRLNKGQWVHTFPEGKINMLRERLRLKWGVGRMIADCCRVPIVLPMWHVGMEDVLPTRSPYIPRIGKRITLLVGEPIDFSEQLEKLRKSKKSPMEIRKALTDRIQEEFAVLKEKAERLHYGSSKPDS